MALLLSLARQPLEVVRRDSLIDEVWSGAAGADNSLTNAVSNLRQAMGGDDASKVIETLPRRGYRLTVAPEMIEKPNPVAESGPLRWQVPSALAALLAIAVLVFFWPDRASGDNAAPTQDNPRVALLPVTAPDSLAAQGFTLGLEAAEAVAALDLFSVEARSDALELAADPSARDILVQTELWNEGAHSFPN